MLQQDIPAIMIDSKVKIAPTAEKKPTDSQGHCFFSSAWSILSIGTEVPMAEPDENLQV